MAKKTFTATRHAHGCRRCAVRYEDACTRPDVDDVCVTCRGGRAWGLLIQNALPHGCCRDNARLVTRAEIDTYKLAGAKTWYRCHTCGRTHPYDPRRPPDTLPSFGE